MNSSRRGAGLRPATTAVNPASLAVAVVAAFLSVSLFAQKKPAPAADNAKALLTKARKAHGGDAILAIKDYTFTGDMIMVTPQGEMTFAAEGSFTMDGRSRMVMKMPVGEIAQSFDGQSLWVKTVQGVREMPNLVPQARGSRERELFAILRNFDQDGYTAKALPRFKLESKEVASIEVANVTTGNKVTVFVDPATGLAAGKSYIGQGMMGAPGEMLESFSDMREVAGIKIPFRIVTTSAGKRTAEQRVKEFKINPGVPNNAFQKPE